jgi:uncharacterized protein
VAAYLKRHRHNGSVVGGFVGIGRIKAKARPIREITIRSKPLLKLDLHCANMADNMESDHLSEYVALVDWISAVPREKAKWESGTFATQLVRASLDRQPQTIAFLEREFDVNFKKLAA